MNSDGLWPAHGLTNHESLERTSKPEAPACGYRVDPLFTSALLGLLEDAPFDGSAETLEKLDAILEVQREFSAKGDRLLTEMRRARTTLKRRAGKGEPIKRLLRSRIDRAGRRAGLPRDWLSKPGAYYPSGLPDAKEPEPGGLARKQQNAALPATSSDRSQGSGERPASAPKRRAARRQKQEAGHE